MMNGQYQETMTADRRLSILLVLIGIPGYQINEYALLTLLENYAHRVSADRLHSDLAWLAEQGLIEVTSPGGVRIARLLTRGQDAAEGRTEVPGVKRPRAG